MDDKGREKFWEVLNSITDSSDESLAKLKEATPTPKVLCRFRAVNDNSLSQLQDNTLYFSTANYYDDPFDTYFYINFERMKEVYEGLKNMLADGEDESIKSMLKMFGLDGDLEGDIRELNRHSLDLPKFNTNLNDIRNSVQSQICSICFSENPLNETMWLKYANNHKGFVLTYDFSNPDTYLCGHEEKCKKCGIFNYPPYPFPVYYSDKKYDATSYALALMVVNSFGNNFDKLPQQLINCLKMALNWQKERISLIKKKCHCYDEEWRLLCPTPYNGRPLIKLKPKSLIIGLRTPPYEQMLIVSAAKIAGVTSINKIVINDNNDLDLKKWEG